MRVTPKGVLRGRERPTREPVVGAWRSLVAHLFWVQGVVSSNLAAPTIFRKEILGTIYGV